MKKQPTKLHLGCGLNTPPDWLNVDGSWNAWLAKHRVVRAGLRWLRLVPRSQLDIPWKAGVFVHDVRKPLPFPSASFEAVYASHILEHLFEIEAKRLLRECHRVLAPGGTLRLVVPDLRAIVLEYLGEPGFASVPKELASIPPADRFNLRLLMRPSEPPRTGLLYRFYSTMKDFHSHKWMYDGESLVAHVQEAGFVEASTRQFCESRIAGIEQVEIASRVLGGEGVCVEAVRPL